MRVARTAAIAVVCVVQGLLVCAPAHATLRWLPGYTIDQSGSPGLVDLACPATTQCTALDGAGRALTLTPGSSRHTAPAVLDPAGLTSVACLSVSECVGVAEGLQPPAGTSPPQSFVTFDPRTLHTRAVAPVNSNETLGSLVCPSSSQCLAIGETNVDCAADVWSFDPASAKTLTHVLSDTSGACAGHFPHLPMSLSCPTASRCVAIDIYGGEVTFDPRAPGNPTPTHFYDPGPLNLNLLAAVACPYASLCVAVSNGGDEVTFDPSSPGHPTPVQVYSRLDEIVTLACPSVSVCVATDRSGYEVTFNPTAPAGAATTKIDGGVFLGAVACPSVSRCVAVGYDGVALTFSPGAPASRFTARVDAGADLVSLSCASVSSCTAVDGNGGAATTNPVTHATRPTAQITPASLAGQGTNTIACPSGTLCAEVGRTYPGAVLVFDPAAPQHVTRTTIESSGFTSTIIACPSVSQCTALFNADVGVQEVTFDPRAPGQPTSAIIAPEHDAAWTLACPSATQCTTGLAEGGIVTFNPQSPGTVTTGTIHAFADGSFFETIACPSSTQCTATDGEGQVATFNPQRPTTATVVNIDSRQDLRGIACATTRLCVAVGASGQAFVGDPVSRRSWAMEIVPGAARLSAVSCPTAWVCLATDGEGDAFTATTLPRPRLTKVHQSHRAWRERSQHGARPVGTLFSLTLNQAARITYAFARHAPGRRAGERCVAQTKRNRHARPCRRLLAAGRLTVNGHAGRNHLRFAGGIPRRHRLRPGTYTVTITAIDRFGERTKPHKLTFTIA
jgi:hypothetical protein